MSPPTLLPKNKSYFLLLAPAFRIPNDETRDTIPTSGSSYSQNELTNFKRLTELKSSCTPKLLAYTETTQPDDFLVPGGFLAVIIMEKIPGRNLSNFRELPMSERNQVRFAFAKAIRLVSFSPLAPFTR